MKNHNTLLLAAGLLCAVAANAQDPQESLAERLVALRGQVDAMQGDLEVRREEHKNRMAYLTAQLSDLEASQGREELRVAQLRADLGEMSAEILAAGVSSGDLLPFLREQVGILRGQVAAGFPFKVRERLAALDELESQLDSGLLTAQRGINRLWAFIEDEFRISRENAIYSQSIPLDGENVLVDVAKLGTAVMFFRTRELEYGRAVPGPQGWRWERLPETGDQEQVARLFDSLRKQIRQGYFELPAALPPTEQGS